MDKFQSHGVIVRLLHLLLPLQLLSLQSRSLSYTPPSKYFINCGSQNNTNHTGRTFVGDVSTDSSFTLSPKRDDPVVDSSPSPTTSQLYQTARIFKGSSSYVFHIDQNGTYLNFSVQNTSNLPLIKEFLLTINISQFTVKFEPSQESSFAFVNAIEVFIAPDSFIPDSALLVTRKGNTLWRNWVPDDTFLFNRSTARNKSYDQPIEYQEGQSEYNNSDRYIAPENVYLTAKEMNTNEGDQLQSFNISWGFNVTKNATHLLRVHFCDITSASLSVSPWINLYINSIFSRNIKIITLAAPFYLDFVVVSDNSGLLNISIGPHRDSPVNNSFLNGLEIMEIMQELGWVSIENESKKKYIPLLVGSVVGGLALVCLVVVVFLLQSKCRKGKPTQATDWLPITVDRGLSSHGRLHEATNHSSPVPYLNLGLKIPFAEVQSATKNFSSKLLVGKGGFGKVYQGTLRNGMKVAVKRSQPGHGQGLPEFQTEILVLSKIHHRHLVSLVGYCDERNEMILVYEFMQKGTLRSHLYDSDLPCLSWKQRLEICIGAARGLHYLHTGSEGGIIHRDIKSTNILLDDNFVAKVADFGLSRSGLPHQTHVSTAVKGTFGYLDPEYFRTQQLTDKSDVYSFGVVLLEVLCARPVINPSLPTEQVNLAEWVMVWQKRGLLEQVIDPLLVGKVNLNSLRKFGETAEKCLQEEGADRPTMGDVVWDLEYAFQLQQTAMQREPLEDSTNDAASTFPLPTIQRYPSYSLSISNIHGPERRDSSSETTESEVFSQLRIAHGR
ncbi:putative receptor-like protein kinase [Vitis vinifera]|uniref:Putative receptor-like protein kinase n=1 Tax=Vitis vinifera TaxID=29760 RepID=A0A438KPM7_VITVI|nr:putative receptor-like protein kinase [Vitis vinifera]